MNTKQMSPDGIREMREMWETRSSYGLRAITQEAFVSIFRCGYFSGRIDALNEQLQHMKHGALVLESDNALLRRQAE